VADREEVLEHTSRTARVPEGLRQRAAIATHRCTRAHSIPGVDAVDAIESRYRASQAGARPQEHRTVCRDEATQVLVRCESRSEIANQVNFLGISAFITFLDAVVLIGFSKILEVSMFANIKIFVIIAGLITIDILMFFLLFFSIIKASFNLGNKVAGFIAKIVAVSA
jgi:hypothetical protein